MVTQKKKSWLSANESQRNSRKIPTAICAICANIELKIMRDCCTLANDCPGMIRLLLRLVEYQVPALRCDCDGSHQQIPGSDRRFGQERLPATRKVRKDTECEGVRGTTPETKMKRMSAYNTDSLS